MKVAAYKFGKRVPIEGIENPDSVVLEVVLDDDRIIQLNINETGQIFLRGWGNTPVKVGNCNKLELFAQLQKEEPTHCEKCHGKLDSDNPNIRCKCR